MAFPWQRKLFFFFLRAVYASKNIYLPFHTKMNLIKSKLKKKSESNRNKKKKWEHIKDKFVLENILRNKSGN